MVKNDKYIGCNEIYPLISLPNSVNWLYEEDKYHQDKLPIFRHKIIQLKKDLERQGIIFQEFKSNLNILYQIVVVKRKVTDSEAKECILSLWSHLLTIENQPHTLPILSEIPLNKMISIFEYGEGFIVKTPLQALPNCFWVEPNWDKHESVPIGRGKQMLVCMIEKIEDIQQIYSYFYKDNYGSAFQEIVFAFNSFKHFTPTERDKARSYFKQNKQQEYVRCIFIQEDDFEKISKFHNWREVFKDAFLISR